jgi:hypothetical protein
MGFDLAAQVGCSSRERTSPPSRRRRHGVEQDENEQKKGEEGEKLAVK